MFNEILVEGWFESFFRMERKKRNFLTHVIFDEAGSIINYKLEYAQEAFGAFIVLLLFKKKLESEKITEDDFQNIWNTYSFSLKKTIEKDFRKSVRSLLKDQPFNSIKEFNQKVKEEAEKKTDKKLKEYEKFFGV